MKLTNTSTTTTNTPSSTPPVFNKHRRDACKGLLTFTTLCLAMNVHILALLASAAALMSVKEGTWWSGENLKWMILSMTSFGATLTSWMLREGSELVDQEKAYNLAILLYLGHKLVQVGWSAILYTTTTPTSSSPDGIRERFAPSCSSSQKEWRKILKNLFGKRPAHIRSIDLFSGMIIHLKMGLAFLCR